MLAIKLHNSDHACYGLLHDVTCTSVTNNCSNLGGYLLIHMPNEPKKMMGIFRPVTRNRKRYKEELRNNKNINVLFYIFHTKLVCPKCLQLSTGIICPCRESLVKNQGHLLYWGS
jgi:hypothetical protein